MWTEKVLRPTARLIFHRLPQSATKKKSTFTILSAAFSLASSFTIIWMISSSNLVIAGIIGVFGYQLSCILDILDGLVASYRKTSSLFGAALDAVADIISMGGVSWLINFAAIETFGLNFGLTFTASAALLLWATSPLSTVAFYSAGITAKRGKTVATLSGKTILFLLRPLQILSDWALILLLLSLSLAIGSSDIFAILLCIVIVTGIAVASGKFLAIGKLDNWS